MNVEKILSLLLDSPTAPVEKGATESKKPLMFNNSIQRLEMERARKANKASTTAKESGGRLIERKDVSRVSTEGTKKKLVGKEGVSKKPSSTLVSPFDKKHKKTAQEDIDNVDTEIDGFEVDTVTFDEEAFADSIQANADSVVAIFVPEEEDEKEYIEISFNLDDSEVVLKVFGDGDIYQVVDAEVIDPVQFQAVFTPTLDKEDNEIEGDITLEIIPIIEDDEDDDEEDDEDVDIVKTEDDVSPDSEEDNDTFDEGGNTDTQEYVDPAGLDLDEYYSTSHNMKPVNNAGNRLDARGRMSSGEKVVGRPRTIRR